MGKTNNYQIAGELTITTTGNIDNLDVKGFGLLRMNNASLATIRGMRAGYDGQIITIVSIGAGQVDLAHQNAGSSAANRLINSLTTFSTPLAAGKGTAIYTYDVTSARWRLITSDQGDAISIPYSAGNFTADVGTWTVDSGDQTTFTYFFIDKICSISLQIDGTSVTVANPNVLLIALPFTPVSNVFSLMRSIDNGTAAPGMFRTVATVAQITCYRDVNANTWTQNTNNTSVQGNIQFRVD